MNVQPLYQCVMINPLSPQGLADAPSLWQLRSSKVAKSFGPTRKRPSHRGFSWCYFRKNGAFIVVSWPDILTGSFDRTPFRVYPFSAAVLSLAEDKGEAIMVDEAEMGP